MEGKDKLGRFTTNNKLGGHTAKQRETIQEWDNVIGAAQVKKLAKKLLDIALNGKGIVQLKAITYSLYRSLGKTPEHIQFTQETQPLNLDEIRTQYWEMRRKEDELHGKNK